MSATRTGTGLKRLQHLVLWVSDVERSLRFYCDVVGFEVTKRYPNAAFLKIPGSADDHHLGLFEQAGVARPDERVARMYHAAWEGDERPELEVAAAAMGEDGLHQVIRAAIVQEEDSLAEAPERRGPELVAPRNPLDDVVGQPRPHIVDQQVREEVDVLVPESTDRGEWA